MGPFLFALRWLWWIKFDDADADDFMPFFFQFFWKSDLHNSKTLQWNRAKKLIWCFADLPIFVKQPIFTDHKRSHTNVEQKLTEGICFVDHDLGQRVLFIILRMVYFELSCQIVAAVQESGRLHSHWEFVWKSINQSMNPRYLIIFILQSAPAIVQSGSRL